MPACLATSLTVSGLSPEITLIATPFSLNHLNVSIASGLTLSLKIIKPTASRLPSTFSFIIGDTVLAYAKTL